jgi:hypothetical protein
VAVPAGPREARVTRTDDELIAILVAQLDEREREAGVAYRALEPVSAGEDLELPRLELAAPWSALLAFVDREPMANWSHRCRYVLIAHETGEVVSVEAQLPPFGAGTGRRWVVAHKGASVPDSVLPDLR